jgi:hypothetical protein
MTIKFHLLVETGGAVAVGSSALLGVGFACRISSIFLTMSLNLVCRRWADGNWTAQDNASIKPRPVIIHPHQRRVLLA